MNYYALDSMDMAVSKLMNMVRNCTWHSETERVSLYDSFGRILAEDVESEENVPAFSKATVDGYALASADLANATSEVPAFFALDAEPDPGDGNGPYLKRGHCIYVQAGGMVPPGADVVVRNEHCQKFGWNQISVYTRVKPGHHVVMAGEDVERGARLLVKGKRINSSDMGLLAAVGKTHVVVYKPWKVFIISTGDEIVSPHMVPGPGQVRDINSYGIFGVAREYGFEVVGCTMVADDPSAMSFAVQNAMAYADIIAISGGSSGGEADYTANVIMSTCSHGILSNGVAIDPGVNTLIGFDKRTSTAVIGLPGHPVAAIMIFRLIAGGMWERFTESMGQIAKKPIAAILSQDIDITPGMMNMHLARLFEMKGRLYVDPLKGRNGLVRILAEADGYFITPAGTEPVSGGTEVMVQMI